MQILNNQNYINSKDIIHKIAHDLENIKNHPTSIGLFNGLTGASLFLFHYAKHTKKVKYENIAYKLLNQVLSSPHINDDNIFFLNGLAGIGCTIDYLIKQEFILVEEIDFFLEFDECIIKKIEKYKEWDYSFSFGLIGLGHYLVKRKIYNKELFSIIIEKILYNFNQSNINSPKLLILFPTEVIEDILLFLLLIEKKGYHSNNIKKLREEIVKIKQNKKVLKSNCPDYYFVQKIRKNTINENKLGVEFLLKNTTIVNNKFFYGLANLSIIDPTLPPWWILI